MASKLLLFAILIVNVIAFGLAVAAEHRRSSAKIAEDEGHTYSYCVYDSDIATGYGVGIAGHRGVGKRMLLLWKAIEPWRSKSLGGRPFHYLLICLLAGFVTNAYHTKYKTIFSADPPDCQTLRKGVFGAGAAFIFLNIIVSSFYYMKYSRATASFQSDGIREASVCLR